MSTIDLLFSSRQTSADFTTMERHILFLDNISKDDLENIKRIRQSVRQGQKINPESTTIAERQVKGTKCIRNPLLDRQEALPCCAQPLHITAEQM